MNFKTTFIFYFNNNFDYYNHAYQDFFFVEIINIFYKNFIFNNDVD